MKKIVLVLLTLVINVSDAEACRCMENTPTMEETFSKADAIFVGEVTGIENIPKEKFVFSYGSIINKFKVSKFWKTPIKDVEFFHIRGGYSCGPQFVEGKSYLIYAFLRQSFDGKTFFLDTGRCNSRAKQLEAADKEVKKLNTLVE